MSLKSDIKDFVRANFVRPIEIFCDRFYVLQPEYPTQEQLNCIPEERRQPNNKIVDQISPFKVVCGFILQILLVVGVVWLCL